MSNLGQIRDLKQQNHLAVLARDIGAVVALGILLICLHEGASPFIRGFYCNDETIRYPHKESTVPSSVCYLIGSGINIILILLLEYRALLTTKVQGSREQNNEFPTRLYLKNIYCRLIVWLFGSIASELITDISKVTAGRLRPHFIDVCKPVIRDNGIDVKFDDYCSRDNNKYQYVTDYYCTGVSNRLRDTRLSFMSGHSSYSAYSAAFAVFYLQFAMEMTDFGMIKPSIQVLIASAAFYTGLTRVSDYKHHWQDVLAGLLQGTTVAAIVSSCVWPALNKSYSKFIKSSTARAGIQDSGEELNPVSY